MAAQLRVRVESIEEGTLKGQRIVHAASGEGHSVSFDLIGDLLEVKEGDSIEFNVTTEKPGGMEGFDLCLQGYLLGEEERHNATLFSAWGIIFRFSPPIGLKPDTKYYLCLRRSKA